MFCSSFHFSSFSHHSKFSSMVFSSFSHFSHFLLYSISFTSSEFSRSGFSLSLRHFFSVYISFSSLSRFCSEMPQFWFKSRFVHLFFILSFFLRFSLIFLNENIILQHFFITPGELFEVCGCFFNFQFLKDV